MGDVVSTALEISLETIAHDIIKFSPVSMPPPVSAYLFRYLAIGASLTWSCLAFCGTATDLSLARKVVTQVLLVLSPEQQKALEGHIVLIDEAGIRTTATLSSLPLSETRGLAAFSLSDKVAHFPIYLRTDSNVFQAALKYQKVHGPEDNPFVYFLASLMVHELAHVQLQADECDAVILELQALDSFEQQGLLSAAMKQRSRYSSYRLETENDKKMACSHHP